MRVSAADENKAFHVAALLVGRSISPFALSCEPVEQSKGNLTRNKGFDRLSPNGEERNKGFDRLGPNGEE